MGKVVSFIRRLKKKRESKKLDAVTETAIYYCIIIFSSRRIRQIC